ncbi:MAG: DUF5996 family protein [Candidatus Nitrosopolaris sp.]
MTTVRTTNLWPALPLAEWKDTYDTLHRWTQIIGIHLHLRKRSTLSDLLKENDREDVRMEYKPYWLRI